MTERDRREEQLRREEEERQRRGAEEPRPTTRASADAGGGTSWPSVVLRWLTALGAGLILSGIIGGSEPHRQSGQRHAAQLPEKRPAELGAIFTVSGLLALLFMFVGGAAGGAWGARTGRRRP